MDRAARILDEAQTRAEVKAAMRQLAVNQSMGQDERAGSRTCPVCGQGLHLRTDGTHFTAGLCFSCGWSKTWNRALDEARMPGETYVPGVTGVPRGTCTVYVGLDGKIKDIRNG